MSLSKKGEGGATVNYNVIIHEICRSQIICSLTIKSETNYHLARTYTRFVAVNALPADR